MPFIELLANILNAIRKKYVLGLIPFHYHYLCLPIVQDNSAWPSAEETNLSPTGIRVPFEPPSYTLDITIRVRGRVFGILAEHGSRLSVTIDGKEEEWVFTGRPNQTNVPIIKYNLKDTEHEIRIKTIGTYTAIISGIVVDLMRNPVFNVALHTNRSIAGLGMRVETVDYVSTVNTIYTARVETKFYGTISVCRSLTLTDTTYYKGKYAMGGTFWYTVLVKIEELSDGGSVDVEFIACESTSATAKEVTVVKETYTDVGDYVLPLDVKHMGVTYWAFRITVTGTAKITILLQKH